MAASCGAGAQWVLQESHSTASLRGIHAVSKDVAWASGSGGTVLRTVDGGAHWMTCAVPDGAKDGAEKLDFRGRAGVRRADGDCDVEWKGGFVAAL